MISLLPDAKANPEGSIGVGAAGCFELGQLVVALGLRLRGPLSEAVSSLNDVALLLEVFLTVDFSASVTLFKDLKTSGTPLATRKRL